MRLTHTYLLQVRTVSRRQKRNCDNNKIDSPPFLWNRPLKAQTSPATQMSPLHPTEKVRDQPQYQLLSNYTNGNDGGASHEATLEAFCEPIETSYKETTNPSAVEERLWPAWQCLIACAAATPHEGSEGQQKLVDLVLGLQHRRAVEKDGKVCCVQGDGEVWRDLPVFGWQMREAWNAGKLDLDCLPSKKSLGVSEWGGVHADSPSSCVR